jgi:ring-1,2-phenylacetyl-CoA epoxidase subunit PaaC
MSNTLINYTLHLADNALILGHRNSEWTGHGPILEQDIAISNIALDLIGQARNFYQYAAKLINENGIPEGMHFDVDGEITEDHLAYLRDTRGYKNCLLVEQPNGDWAQTILRQFFFTAYQHLLYQQLLQSTDAQLAAIAEKSVKETTYHLRWSSDWVIRLGDGTEESKQRMENAIEHLWPYTAELFNPADFESKGLEAGWAVDLSALEKDWMDLVNKTFEEATLLMPNEDRNQQGGKTGAHSEHHGFILAELQFLQRAYPNSTW